MKKLPKAVIALKIWKDKHRPDLEYALMVGFVAVAAGALIAAASRSITTGFSTISTVMAGAATR